MKIKMTISKLIIDLVAGITFISILFAFLQIVFWIKDYRYFEYNNQKYYLDSNLSIKNAIIYNADGEFSDFQNCTWVIVKIDGWFPKRMLLHNSEGEMFIFDTDKSIWGIKNGDAAFPSYDFKNISNVFVEFWDDSQDYMLNTEDVQKIRDIGKQLVNSPATTIDWENAPIGIRNGTLNISYKTFPSDVTYSMFYFSVTEKGNFLMSLTDGFGLKYGLYTITADEKAVRLR